MLGRRHRITQAVIDAVAWSLALPLATVLRHEFVLSAVDWKGVSSALLIAIELQVFSGLLVGLYLARWRFGSFEEVGHLVGAVTAVTLVLAALDRWALDHAVPVGAAFISGVLALVLMAGARYAWRLWVEHKSRPHAADSRRVIVLGAGKAGEQVVAAMLRGSGSRYCPVAFLDDDPWRRNLSIKGVRVEGTRNDLGRVARKHAADDLLIAIPSADSALVREVSAAAAGVGLAVTVLPTVEELVTGTVGVRDIRGISERDLLGRRQISLDVESIAHYLTGKRVLVTGAGGSIGSELCRQIYRFAPAQLVMLDSDESNLHQAEMSIHGRAMLDGDHLVVACIRDARRVDEVFAACRPEVVFHAAALKHLPLLEIHPCEAVRTNVFGTLNVLEAATRVGVDTFVNISTDKAADPTSVLGYTKRVTERLTAHFDGAARGSYLSVRFGNVLGSRGSVISTFREQIALGGPVTVTDPNVTRYFMTVEEAVQLVIQAGAYGDEREVLVLDMGEPVLIADVAKRMIEHSEREIQIEFTGLRAGEKLEEALVGSDETPKRRDHPLILHVHVEPLEPAALEGLDDMNGAELVDELSSLVISAGSQALPMDTAADG